MAAIFKAVCEWCFKVVFEPFMGVNIFLSWCLKNVWDSCLR